MREGEPERGKEGEKSREGVRGLELPQLASATPY